MSAPEPEILSMDKVRQTAESCRGRSCDDWATAWVARLCATVEHYARAAEAGPTREICSECFKLSAVGFHVPNEIWLAAIPPGRQEDIFCIACFAHLADRAYLAWDADIRFEAVSKRRHRERWGEGLNEPSLSPGAEPNVAAKWSRLREKVEAMGPARIIHSTSRYQGYSEAKEQVLALLGEIEEAT